LLGFLLALCIDWVFWPVRSAAAIEGILGVPLLGVITSRNPAEVTSLGPQLVRAIDFLGVDHPLQTIAVVSPETNALASTVASSLAVAESAEGRRTLLVDAQLAAGRQSQQFGIAPAPGLSNAVLELPQAAPEGFSLVRYAQRPVGANVPQLLVLPSGTPPPNPYQVLSSRAMDRVLVSLEQSEADSIILDAPPLIGHPRMGRAASVLLRHVNGVLLVVDLEHTRKDHLLRAQRLLAAIGVRVLGCVVAGPPLGASAKGASEAAMRPPRGVPEGTYQESTPGGNIHDE